MDRHKNIGCVWGVHLLITLACWTGVFNSFDTSQLVGLIVFGVLAVMETVLVIGMRFCWGQRWVWNLGYMCWFTLIVFSLIPWVMMFISPPPKDSIETGMIIVFLPLMACLTAIPVAGVIQWNAIQIQGKQ